jgi:hypothetical protein
LGKRRHSHKIEVIWHLLKIPLGISIGKLKNSVRNDLKAKEYGTVGVDL